MLISVLIVLFCSGMQLSLIMEGTQVSALLSSYHYAT